LAAADVALLYYAGHGLQVGSENYLVPIDAKLGSERDLDFEAIKLAFILRQMEIDREGRTSIIILDACRDNPLARNLARSMGTRSTSIGRGLAAESAGLGTFISYSTQPGNVALDGDGRNSPFAKALIKHLAKKGSNLQATMIAVRKDVVAATNGMQVPWDHSAMTGDFYFVPGDSTPAEGPVSAPPTGANTDVIALQERLRKLEDESKTRANAPTSAVKGENVTPAELADMMKLAELRARAANVADLAKDLQKKLMDARLEEGRAANPEERSKLIRNSMNIQMDWTRRGIELKKINEDIAALEGRQRVVANPKSAMLPVVAKSKAQKDSPNFETAENVSLHGTEIRSFRAQNPVACRDACEKEKHCVGYQHGRKLPVMGTCTLFSQIDSRHEDQSWFSGLRNHVELAQ
jgi:hypothetical protein